MAGLGYGRGKGPSGGSAVGKGIMFVKSSETLHAESPSSSDHNTQGSSGSAGWGCPAAFSQPGSAHRGPTPLLATPPKSSNYRDQSQWNSPLGAGDPNHSGAFRFGQTFTRSGNGSSGLSKSSQPSGERNNYRMPGTVNLSKGAPKSRAPLSSFSKTPDAKPVLSKEEYFSMWKSEKDLMLQKFRKLANEVVSLKTDRPNAIDKLHSAANRVPIRIVFNTEPVFGAKGSNSFLCYVFVEGITVASGQGLKIKDSKTNAYEAALQKILMPHMRIVKLDPESSELQVSKTPFTSPPPEPSKVSLKKSSAKLPPSAQGSAQNSSRDVASQHKESNLEAACLKRRLDEYKPLEEFVIVEPLVPIPDCTPAHTLRRSADFNHMLLEYEYFFRGEAARCVLKIENQVLADVNGVSKVAAKNNAAAQALRKLRNICWVIKTKKAVDSDTKISKEEMLNELNEQSDVISHDNIGNKLLRKMGWSGGGVGKDGSGIAEPVVLKSVLNREGLGLSAQRGITDEFKKRVREVIENYASSDNQEDLVFACDFRLDERQVIHDECRRLNLRSKSRGKGQQRYLCVRRKRSADQLFNHIMSCGGETARYVMVPPGTEASEPVMPPRNKSAGSQNSSGRTEVPGMDKSNKNSVSNCANAKPLMSLSVNPVNGFDGKSMMNAPVNGPRFQQSDSLQQKGPVFQGMPNMQGNTMNNGPHVGNHQMSNNGNFQGVGNQFGMPQNMGSSQSMGNQFGNGLGFGMMNVGNSQSRGMLGMGNNQMRMQNGQNNIGVGNARNGPFGMQHMPGGSMGNQQTISNGHWGAGAGQWGNQEPVNGGWQSEQGGGWMGSPGAGYNQDGRNMQPRGMPEGEMGNYR